MLLVVRCALVIGAIYALSPERAALDRPAPPAAERLREAERLWAALPPALRTRLLEGAAETFEAADPATRLRLAEAAARTLAGASDTLRPDDRRPPWRGGMTP